MERLGERCLSARVTVGRGVVGFGMEYACAHIIILAEISRENLLPIRTDFVTERVKRAQEKAWGRETSPYIPYSRIQARSRPGKGQKFSLFRCY